jgi:hypothetical protein
MPLVLWGLKGLIVGLPLTFVLQKASAPATCRRRLARNHTVMFSKLC